jgi:hypothetical protein
MCVRACVHVCTCVCVRVCVYACVCVVSVTCCAYASTFVVQCACVGAHTLARAPTHTHTNTHTRIHTHKQTCTHAWQAEEMPEADWIQAAAVASAPRTSISQLTRLLHAAAVLGLHPAATTSSVAWMTQARSLTTARALRTITYVHYHLCTTMRIPTCVHCHWYTNIRTKTYVHCHAYTDTPMCKIANGQGGRSALHSILSYLCQLCRLSLWLNPSPHDMLVMMRAKLLTSSSEFWSQ